MRYDTATIMDAAEDRILLLQSNSKFVAFCAIEGIYYCFASAITYLLRTQIIGAYLSGAIVLLWRVLDVYRTVSDRVVYFW